MDNISRRRLVRMLAGVPFIMAATWRAFASQNGSLSASQIEAVEVMWHAGTLAGYGTNNMLVPSTGYAISLLSNTPQNDHWKPADVAIELYNAASLGPKLPPLLKRVRSTLPH